MAGEYLHDAVERVSIVDHEGKSGALLERVTLADGRHLIVKRFSPGTDLLMAALGDVVGREYVVWSRGILDLLPPEVGHAVVDGWADGDETVIVMRDLGDSVLTWQDRLTRDQCRSMLTSVAAQHREFQGAAPEDLTPLPDLLSLFAPLSTRPGSRSSPTTPRPRVRHMTSRRCGCRCSAPWYGSDGTRYLTRRSIRTLWCERESSRT